MVLVQTQKVTSFPIVLVGSAFWNPLMEWVRGTLLEEGMIAEVDLDLVRVVDTAEDAVEGIVEGLLQSRGRPSDSIVDV
jgi:predicted Rossmann-fold nucleotide-binding protein